MLRGQSLGIMWSEPRNLYTDNNKAKIGKVLVHE